MTSPAPEPTSPRALPDLAQITGFVRRFWVRVGLVVGVLCLILGLLWALDLDGDLSYVDAGVLSGPTEGNYHARVDRLAEAAASNGGTLRNLPTAGSVDNVERLVASATSGACDADFALVQEGLTWPSDGGLRLLGRLPRSESLFLLSAQGDRYTKFEQLRGVRVGVGPRGSGTELVARALFESPELAPLGVELVHHDIEAQLDLLERGELALGAFVIDEDSELVRRAVVERGLQPAALEHLDALAHRLPSMWIGRVAAGQFDPVAVLPATDRHVLRIDTLVVANDCPSRSERMALLGLIASQEAGFIGHNKARPNLTGLPLDDAAADFYEEGGAGFVDRYFPWVVDLMPLGNWVYLVMAVSVLFNLMGAGHRFRLWRIDANRVRLEQYVHELFGATTTLVEIDQMTPSGRQLEPEFLDRVTFVVDELEALLRRSRRHAVSLLVPMGGELTYRYQEHTIADAVDTLRAFRTRALAERAVDDATPSSPPAEPDAAVRVRPTRTTEPA